MSGIPNFSKNLIEWYEDNKRDLPWRKTKDPYIIWVSEIILQQTRVEQGISYFKKFINKYPNVKKLASAKEEDVLKLWQGLGYYSRARNMHQTAQTIVKQHNGKFPEDYAAIINLKGIGEYTASAITSFAFKMPYPVIDGNVIRVVTRLFGIDQPITSSEVKKRITKHINQLFSKEFPDTFNQAIMEFGALQCIPVNPNCENCFSASNCISYNTGKVKSIPAKKNRINKRKRYFNYAVIKLGNSIVLKKRMEKDIWQNLYDFPMIEKTNTEGNFNFEDLQGSMAALKNKIDFGRAGDWKIHILSHQKIFARFHEFDIRKKDFQLADDWELIEIEKIGNYPVPKLIETYINEM